MKRIWVLGAGGHSKSVVATLLASGHFEILGLLDDDMGHRHGKVLGFPVLGPISLESINRYGIELAIIAIGDNRVRAELAGRFRDRIAWATTVHPSAHLAPGVCIGEGTVVLAGAVVQPETTVGRHAILNTACSVDHDCSVGDFVHVAPGTHLAGESRIGEGALLGIGSCTVPGRSVGPWAVVGAGGVVIHDVPAGATAKGIPARTDNHNSS